MLRNLVVALSVSGVLVVTAYGCTSSSSGTPTPATDSGTPKKDTGTNTPEDATAAANCAPGDVSSYTSASYKAPNGKYQNKCDMKAIADWLNLPPDAGGNAAFDKAFGDLANNKPNDCFKCVWTQSTAAAWGPIIEKGQDAFLNTNGCIDLYFGGGLGKKKADRDGCYQLACDDNCPIADPQNVTPDEEKAYNDCANAAIAGDCKKFQDALEAAADIDAASLADAGPTLNGCTAPKNGTDQQITDWQISIINLFCGK